MCNLHLSPWNPCRSKNINQVYEEDEKSFATPLLKEKCVQGHEYVNMFHWVGKWSNMFQYDNIMVFIMLPICIITLIGSQFTKSILPNSLLAKLPRALFYWPMGAEFSQNPHFMIKGYLNMAATLPRRSRE